MVGQIIADAVALIASATTPAWASAHKIQTASLVNHPAENVTNAPSIQEDVGAENKGQVL